jgi:DNA repair protein RecN (Recombination protein N)
MMTSLYIRNYALIEELAVELGPGLTIITGETGAGKSIIVDALGLILGERASSDVIRSGAQKAIVEGTFSPHSGSGMDELLSALEIDKQESVILRREITQAGQSRCFINDTPVQLSMLKKAGDLLVDFHGQHEHQSLLRRQTHAWLLDSYAGLEEDIAGYRESLARLKDRSRRLQEIRRYEQESRERQDLHEFQLREIDAVAPQPEEEESLLNEVRILEHAEQLTAAARELYEALYEGTSSAYEILCRTRDRLSALSSVDSRLAEASAEGGSAAAVVAELARFLREYADRQQCSPERLEEVRDRLGRLSLLKKKFGGSIDQVLAHRQKIIRELEAGHHYGAERDVLEQELPALRADCLRRAEKLSSHRRTSAKRLEGQMKKELAALGIPRGSIMVAIVADQADGPEESDGWDLVRDGDRVLRLNDRGTDRIEFMASLNKGEDLRPLAKVASGGEISRIMLAMKGILANSDTIPVVVFDEIDVGVSGRIAQAVGLSLRKLAQSHQVIAITHLPQIAGMADRHYAVTKKELGARTTTLLRVLDEEERVREVARLLSGSTITEAALTGARELMSATHHQTP